MADLPLVGFNLDPQRKPVFFCVACGVELDCHDVDANLTQWGVFKCYCSDCIGAEEQDHVVPRHLRMD